MKMKSIKTKFLCVAMALFATFNVLAYNESYYASSSKLSQGKWVKIKVSTTGVQEISYDELRAFGFSDPTKVKVFGYGGEKMSEIFRPTPPLLVDDLNQVAIMRQGEKIYFYGKSGYNSIVFGASSTFPRFIPSVNPYSRYGYYFLTDSDSYSELTISERNPENDGTVEVSKCYDYAYHEEDLINIGQTGQSFLGEDMLKDNPISLEMKLPGIMDGESMMVNPCIAVSSKSDSYMYLKINDEDVKFNVNSNKIAGFTSSYQYYGIGSCYTAFTPSSASSDITAKIGYTNDGTVKSANLDYFYIRYTRHPGFAGKESQTRAYYHKYKKNMKLVFENVDDNSVLWYLGVNNLEPGKPVRYTLNLEPDGSGKGSCTPKITDTGDQYSTSPDWVRFVMFDPTRTQYKVEKVEDVKNQNLHGMKVPDMLIITTKSLMPQAQRLARLHADIDNMEVAVVDHTEIFNEFSSGTPDASAYRRFGKMFYDRDPEKFRYILIFGTGSYDNRGIANGGKNEMLLTYQSDKSYEETQSFTTDDFFTYYTESQLQSLTREKMCVAIGRMPVATPADAKNAIDKLEKYLKSDNKSWRNNLLVVTDGGEGNLFSYQAEGVERLVNDTLNVPMHITKVFGEQFNNYVPEMGTNNAEQKMAEALKCGQLVATYIGHGGPQRLSKHKSIWSYASVKNNQYNYFPVFSLATCDVARYDSGERGVAEQMFHQPDGGAVALLASSRTVYANENDMLNRAFLRALLTPNSDGSALTVGEAVKAAKNSFAQSSLNKLNFLLLGDPAMRVNYPRHQIVNCRVNGENVTENSITVYPMSKIKITGSVNKPDGTHNASFNGHLTATVYDRAEKFADLTISSSYPTITSYMRNNKLAQVDADVVGGSFDFDLLIPAECSAQNENVVINLYAVDEKTGDLVNGALTNVMIAKYDSSKAITDTSAPVISEMWMNEEQFTDGDKIVGSALLHFAVEDDNAINNKYLAPGKTITLLLDGKYEIENVDNEFSFNVSTNKGEADMDLSTRLTEGAHTLKVIVNDVAGNRAERIIRFYYEPTERSVDVWLDEAEVRTQATFDCAITGFDAPECCIVVTDIRGNVVWQKDEVSFPYVWNLLLDNGERIAVGKYKYFVRTKENVASAGSPIREMIVVK